MLNPSITVDFKGNLHIHALVAPAGLSTLNFATDLYNMTKDTLGNWGLIHTAQIAKASCQIGSGANMLTYSTFADISRSFEGKYIIYQWSGNSNATTANLTNLAAGTYNLTVIDANSCQMNAAPVTITAPAALTAQINIVAMYFAASVTGGTAPYTYSWTGPVCFTPPTSSTPNISINCPTCSGVYNCFITDANGCNTTANTTCVLAIEKEIGLTSFSLVPNPAFEVATLSLAFERSENVTLSILNVHGQSIFEKKMGNVLNFMEDIKVKDWAKGIYYVKISTDSGIITRKLAIN